MISVQLAVIILSPPEDGCGLILDKDLAGLSPLKRLLLTLQGAGVKEILIIHKDLDELKLNSLKNEYASDSRVRCKLHWQNKKDFSRFLISIAYEFNNQEVKKFTNHYNFEKFSNSRKTFKKLIYESSKIYTNFYDEQIKFEKKQRNGFTTKEHPKIFVIWGTPQNPKKIILKKGGNKLTRDTYEIIDGHPIYYQILKILIKEFDVNYEELSKDIENKLL